MAGRWAVRAERWGRRMVGEPMRRRAALVAFAAVAGFVALLALEYVRIPHSIDAETYLAAGERLNAGHSLYGALAVGDRTVPYGTADVPAPLLSPPLIAVLWRPLALFGYPAMIAWTLLALVAFAATIIALGLRAPALTALTLGMLSVSAMAQAVGGNVNAFVLLGTVGVWRWHRSYPGLVGCGLAVLIGVKILPVFMLFWMIGQHSWRATGWTLGAGIVLIIATAIGAGPGEFDAYLALRPSASGLVATMGLPWWLPYTAGIALSGASVIMARRPGLSYIVAVAAMVLGTAVVNFHTLALALAGIAPFAWADANHRAVSDRPLGESGRFTVDALSNSR